MTEKQTPRVSKPRPEIPRLTATEVMFQSDRCCCVCEEPGDHIHHLNGNRKDNRFENLIFLCFKHHNEASIKGSLKRKLTPEVLKKYREAGYEKIRNKRNPKGIQSYQDNTDVGKDNFQLITDALICLEIQKLHWQFSLHEWNDAGNVVCQLRMFKSIAGYRARIAIMEFLNEAASKIRFHMPEDVAQLIAQVTFDFLPINSLRNKQTTPLKEFEIELLKTGTEIAESLIYDGAVKLGNLAIVLDGSELLWKLHLFALINEYKPVIETVQEKYTWLFTTLNRPGLADAARLLRIFHDHALTLALEYPLLPDALEDKTMKSKRHVTKNKK